MKRISYKLDTEHIKLAYAFLMSMPGVPYIYYGDEIGMRYLDGIISVEGGYERTGSRSPMQWDNTPNSGFSTASPEKLYIMTDPSSDRPTVEDQLADENSLLNELKKLIAIRKSHKALQESSDIELVSVKSYPLIYKRTAEDSTILVIINPSDSQHTQSIDLYPKEVIYSYNGECEFKDGKLIIPPCSAYFILI
ncbi:MAG: alpha-amylase family glycosyl hydrolase [Candidatus Ornithomonoglobus sp.]